MPRVAHRITPNRARELRERVWSLVAGKLAGRVICAQCGATYEQYEDKCTADIGVRCPGVDAVDVAKAVAEKQVGLT